MTMGRFGPTFGDPSARRSRDRGGSPMFEGIYRQIVEGSPEAIILGDAKGIIQLWNEGARAIFGFTSEEAVGQSMEIIIPERLRARHWEGYDKVMATGTSRYGRG